MDIEGTKIIATAGHVLMNGQCERLCFANKNNRGVTGFEGTWFPSSANNKDIGTDKDDFAYLLLNDSLVRILIDNGYRFISLDNINQNHQPSSNNIYTAIGYRWRKTKRTGINHHSTMDMLSTFGANSNKYKSYNDTANLIIVNNSRKMLYRPDITLGFTGYLDGISGGSLWHTHSNHDYNQENPSIELVGILHSYDSESIVATNIGLLLQLLFERNQI